MQTADHKGRSAWEDSMAMAESAINLDACDIGPGATRTIGWLA
jgi:hypothetical protein